MSSKVNTKDVPRALDKKIISKSAMDGRPAPTKRDNDMFKFNKLLTEFEAATIAMAWKGSQPVDDYQAIEQRYNQAIAAIRRFVYRMK